MNLDFDKEIDILLRKAQRDGPVYVGDVVASPHLDADEISAFAENALPEKTRPLYMAHLADCDRCRTVLSNLLRMNAEAAPLAAAASPLPAITIAERDLPWYRKLFLFPNLAYVMGSLVLIFGGFLAFTVIQNAGLGDSAMVSQAPEPTETRGGPNFQTEPEFNAESAANAMANVTTDAGAANTNSSFRPVASQDPGVAGPRTGENNFTLDGVPADAEAGAVATPAPPPAVAGAAQPAPREDLALKAKPEAKAAEVSTADTAKNDASKQQYNFPAQSGPMRNSESQYNRQLENLEMRKRSAAKRAEGRDGDSSGGRRVVGGKTFERKQSVWYDTTFQGRPTINVRRGTEEFNRLDAGLRSIANNLPGTIVVVWGAKAYRIQ